MKEKAVVILLAILNLVFTLSPSPAQTVAPVTTIPEQEACPGQRVEFPVTVTGFNGIGAVSLTILYNSQVLTEPQFTNTSGVISLGSSLTTPGVIRLSGFTSAAGGVSLADGATFFTLSFTFQGGVSALAFDHTYSTTCQYGGPPPGYAPLADSPKSDYFIDGEINPGAGPVITAGSNSPVNVGGTILLTATPVAGATYNWSGPGGFVSSEQNPVIGNADFSNAGEYSVTATLAGCVGPEATTSVAVIDPGACIRIDAKVYLEGALINPVTSAEYTVPMRTTLNDLQMLPGQAYQDGATIFYTPAGQPYNTEPWNYDGAEGSLFDTGGSVGDAGYPATAVDWVLVSLRNTAGAGYQKICEKAALLLSDGTIEMLEGFDCCDLDMNGNYYLVVEHRNHLLVMSHVPVQVVAGTLTYDFTTQNSYVLPGSGAIGQKEAGGIWFMFGGNGNQSQTGNSDTDINADDQSTWENHNGKQGYRPGDYNLNGDTNSNDQIIWDRNNGRGTSVIRDY